VTANAENQTKMYTQGSDIRSSLARYPENRKVAVFIVFEKLRIVNSTDSKLALDGRNQRRPLEEGTSKGL
jgi:hypothetical protein